MADVTVACPDCGEMVPAPALGDHVCDPAKMAAMAEPIDYPAVVEQLITEANANGDHVTDTPPPPPPAPTEPIVDHAQQVQVGGVIGYVAQLMDRMVTDPQGPNVPTPWPEGPDTAHLDFAAVVVLVLADVLELPADALQTISTGLLAEEPNAAAPEPDRTDEPGAGGEPTTDEPRTENDDNRTE